MPLSHFTICYKTLYLFVNGRLWLDWIELTHVFNNLTVIWFPVFIHQHCMWLLFIQSSLFLDDNNTGAFFGGVAHHQPLGSAGALTPRMMQTASRGRGKITCAGHLSALGLVLMRRHICPSLRRLFCRVLDYWC